MTDTNARTETMTDGPMTDKSGMRDAMTDRRSRGNFTDGIRRLVLPAVLCLLALALFVAPRPAQAWPGKTTSCTSCHTAVETIGTIVTAVDGVVATTATVAPGGSFEIDWKFTGLTPAGETIGIQIAVPNTPSAWTVAAGTVNSPAIAGWSAAWDAAGGVGYMAAGAKVPWDTSAQYPNSPISWSVDHANSAWGNGGNTGAVDDASAKDLDGIANTMGNDARITVPVGTTNGSYQVVVFGVGHSGGGTTKGYIAQTITVTISGGGDVTGPIPGAVSVSPEFTTFVPGSFSIATSFTDAESAVTSCEYTVNGITWLAGIVSGAGPYTCSATPAAQANGSNLTINMRATSSGGVGTATAIARTVDAAAPITGSDAPAGWQTADVTVALTPTDGVGSAVASTQYCVDTVNSCVPATSGTSVSVTQAAGTAGTQYVRYRSSDNTGNSEGVQSATVQIDKAAPVDGILTVVPSNTQNGLSWTVASDSGSGLRAANTYDVRFVTGAVPPADCASGASVYSGIATSYAHTGLSNGTAYSYRVCAYDNINNVSTGATGTGTPAAVCTEADPTLTILEANKQIGSGGGSVVYTLQVTNNDSLDCGDTSFSLSANDGNAGDFLASVLGTANLLVSPGSSNTTSLTVTATGGPVNGASNATSVGSAAIGGHAAVTSPSVTTLINLPRTTTISYNVGETVHVEFRTDTRFAGSGIVSIATADLVSVVNAVPMLETQQGTQWVYTYDWDTSAAGADTYMVQITDGGDADPTPTTSVVLANPGTQLNLFADAGYTTPTDVFADGATIYAEVKAPLAETGVLSAEIDSYYGGASAIGATITQTGTTFRFNFPADFIGAGMANGEWGYVYFQGVVNSGLSLHRSIQRNDAGCGSCTYSTPTVSIVTPNQTILIDGGTANYTINVTNNDTVACGPTSFDLVAVDTNLVNFNPSTFALDPLNVNPGVTGSTTLDVTVKAGQGNGVNNGSHFYTAADGNHAQSGNSTTVATDLNVADVTAPTVDAFSMAPTSTSLSVPVLTFSASDAIGVTGYLITESAIAPLPGAAGWTGTPPGTYTVAGSGSYTLYAWAKDAAGNVSTSLSAGVDVDSIPPSVTSFTMPATSTSQTITVTQFLASDDLAVAGYLITESATPPLPAAAGWTAGAPATFTVASDGSKTLHPWAKDAIGNVSAAYGSPAAVLVDSAAPSVSSTVPANASTGVALDISVTINFSEPVDCGTVNATNIVSDSPGWTYDGTSCTASGGNQAIFNTSGQAYLTLYNVSVGSGVTDPAGNALSPAPHNLSYTTMAEACTYNAPSVSIDTANQNATVDGDWLNYTITISNNDFGGCGGSTFNLAAVDSNAVDFDPSTFDIATITLSPLASGTRTLTVKAKSGSLNGASNDTYFYTASDANHAQSGNSGMATTIIAVPCTLAPTVSITTGNQQIATDGGSAPYTVQVQNDNALACGATAFNLQAVDDNGAAFAAPSVFTVDPLSVNPGGGTNSTTLTVAALVGAANGAVNNSYFYTAINGSIPASVNSNVVSTTINRPCVRNAPSFSTGVNSTVAKDGTVDYTLTVINNDVDCADSTFTFGLDSEVDSSGTSFITPSSFSAPNVVIASGATSGTAKLTVTGSGSGVDGDTLTSTVHLSDATNHAGQDQTSTAVTTVKIFNPLIHSSLSTGSTKHTVDGGWGVAGGRYGEFTCGTCHQSKSGNIKRIRTTLPNAPDTGKGNFSGAGGAISFLDAEDVNNPAEFGNDDVVPRASSNRICETCHIYDVTRADGVDRHASNQALDANHYDGEDCTKCHSHNSGFSAAGATCDSCHGYPPQPGDGFPYQGTEGKGAHLKHVNHLAALAGVTLDPSADSFGDANVTRTCGACHDMASLNHQTGGGAAASRNIDFNTVATFQFGPNPPNYNGVKNVPSGTTPKTCSNISCHFQSSPWWE